MNAEPSGLRKSDAPRDKPRMSQANALRCPSSEEHFRLEDYDTEKGVLSCSQCKALLTFSLPPGARRGAFAPREEAPLPREIRLLKTKEGIELRHAWCQPAFVLLAMFCLVWDGFFV